MEHLAIMKKSYLKKIISGEKTIETRWYKTRRTPWNKIKKGEIIYFKNSGEDVILKVKVKDVIQYENLDSKKIYDILYKFGKEIGISDIEKSFENVKDKKYCILVFLENIQKIKPFSINKKGFGLMSAWISVDNINLIKE